MFACESCALEQNGRRLEDIGDEDGVGQPQRPDRSAVQTTLDRLLFATCIVGFGSASLASLLRLHINEDAVPFRSLGITIISCVVAATLILVLQGCRSIVQTCRWMLVSRRLGVLTFVVETPVCLFLV